jgi:hypothetical protein
MQRVFMRHFSHARESNMSLFVPHNPSAGIDIHQTVIEGYLPERGLVKVELSAADQGSPISFESGIVGDDGVLEVYAFVGCFGNQLQANVFGEKGARQFDGSWIVVAAHDHEGFHFCILGRWRQAQYDGHGLRQILLLFRGRHLDRRIVGGIPTQGTGHGFVERKSAGDLAALFGRYRDDRLRRAQSVAVVVYDDWTVSLRPVESAAKEKTAGYQNTAQQGGNGESGKPNIPERSRLRRRYDNRLFAGRLPPPRSEGSLKLKHRVQFVAGFGFEKRIAELIEHLVEQLIRFFSGQLTVD